MRRGVAAAVGAAALALPGAAWAHAALLRTVPNAGVTAKAPRRVGLVFSEAVEPRFAIVSVTDAAGRQETVGLPSRAPANPDELVAPLRRLAAGWYLVFWRVISDDGHPARGAFTFAVGPKPGPAPQFVIPSLSETAATPKLVVARWVVFLSLLAAVGLFVLRVGIARPLVTRVPGTRLRVLSLAFWITLAVAAVATPAYALLATAEFALRSFWSFGALVPLMRMSAFGRGYLDLELLLALLAAAAAVALWLDRPERGRRSLAALLSAWGALLAAGAALLVPGAAGHAAQTSPRWLALALDWIHLVAASVWMGGLVGLLVLAASLPVARRVAGLAVCVPRFSNAAFVSVLALLGAGIGSAVLHLPTLASLWQTSYGVAILVKAGLLLAAGVLAAVNLLQRRPAAALRRLVAGEVVLAAAAVCAAAVLSSLPPPPKALAAVGGVGAHTGPGPVARVVDRNGYRLAFHVTPNRAAVPNDLAVRITQGGAPVRGATVVVTLMMLDMEMPPQSYRLAEHGPGSYERSGLPALVMVGRWGLAFQVQPVGSQPFSVTLLDRADG